MEADILGVPAGQVLSLKWSGDKHTEEAGNRIIIGGNLSELMH